jgi:GTP-binding protein
LNTQEKIRNIAIIAHVDHGKTTLVDAFLKQTHVFRDNQGEMKQEMILDFNTLEREKGITIKAKNISVEYNGYTINIVDTPGHADFGGEVERTLNMAEGCLLIVDAKEGPMPQTRFVLKKALELGLKPIVIVNKIDKEGSNMKKTLDKVQDLFLNLAKTEDQLDFPVFYAIGRDGKVWEQMPTDTSEDADIQPLLAKIVEAIPAPKGDDNAPFQMQITSVDFDPHVGRFLIGKILNGKVKRSDNVVIAYSEDDKVVIETKGQVKKLMVKTGMTYEEVSEAYTGNIVAIAGIDSKHIGATMCEPNNIIALPDIKISDPSVRIKIETSTSPFLGQEGDFVTAKQLQARLEKESENNISLIIDKVADGSFYVTGRGDLQLSILIEELRREGFEFQVRRPEVVIKEIDGKKHEPLEELFIEVPEVYGGSVLNIVNSRKGELVDMTTDSGQTVMNFKILTSNLLGLRNLLLTETKGNLIMNNYLIDYVPLAPREEFFRRGVLISLDTGVTVAYTLNTIQERGELLVEPATKVYEGMIIGINKYEQDLEVNPTKERAKTAVRRNQAEITQVQLKSIKQVTLEFALQFLAKDEILEVTPKTLRLRKQYLSHNEREWSKRGTLTEFAKQKMGIG